MTRRLLNIALIYTLLLLLLSSCKADTNNPVVTPADVESATRTTEAYLSNLAALASTAASRPRQANSNLSPTPASTLPSPQITESPGPAGEPNTLDAMAAKLPPSLNLTPAADLPPAILNLAQDFCSAQWQTNQGLLGCPGDSNSGDGFVVTLASPRLENRNENEIALHTHPPLAEGSWISGTYPPFVVQSGDRFLADVGCLADFSGCQVKFLLGFVAAGAEPSLLGQWTEVYDQSITRLDVDLSSLAGQSIQLILGVHSQGDASQAGAFWLVPHIARQP